MARRVVAAVEDLLFKSKIMETAEHVGVEVSFPRSPRKFLAVAAESPPDLLVLDLNSGRFEPLKLLEELKSGESTRDVPVVGYLSHVQKDLAVAAKEMGCDRIVARSAFTKDLPKILAGGAADDAKTGGAEFGAEGEAGDGS